MPRIPGDWAVPRLMAANVDANDDVTLKVNNSDNVTLTTNDKAYSAVGYIYLCC